MALYLVELPAAKGGQSRVNKTKAMIVESDDTTKAKLLASAQDEGDADWSDATVTAIAAGVLSDYEGFTYRVRVGPTSGSDASDILDVSYAGVASDTIDLIGAALANVLKGESLAAAVADDGGSFTDETSEANDDTTGDMTILPAAIAENDAYYFALSSKQFNRLVVDMSQAGAGTYTLTWEYYNGSGWSALTGASGDLKSTGLNVITWTTPSNWAKTTINSQGPFYYVRARADTGTMTTQPLGTRAFARGYTSAAYTAGSNTLKVAAGSGVDDLGNKTLIVTVIPKGATGPIAEMVGTITHQGTSTADLTVVLGEPTAIPAVMRKL